MGLNSRGASNPMSMFLTMMSRFGRGFGGRARGGRGVPGGMRGGPRGGRGGAPIDPTQ